MKNAIKVPIFLSHNTGIVIGCAEIEKKYIVELKDHHLGADYIAHKNSDEVKELIGFGLSKCIAYKQIK